jgi:hypothetical protein
MSKPHFGPKSSERLKTMHSDIQSVLIAVMAESETPEEDFIIIWGWRSEEEQRIAFEKGTSHVLPPKSYHNCSERDDGSYDMEMSDAGDTMPWPIEWPDKENDTPVEYVRKMLRIYNLAYRILKKAEELDIELEWGGMFKNFFDGPHYQRKRC